MGELKELYKAEIAKGISIRHLSMKTGINTNTLYSFCKAQYGKQLPTKENYLKLRNYFGEEILINGESIIYPINHDRAIRFQNPEESAKFQQTLNILEYNERTIIPNCFVGHEERLLDLLRLMGIKAKYWYIENNGYLERVENTADHIEKEEVQEIEEEVMEEYIENEMVDVGLDDNDINLSVDGELKIMADYLVERAKDKLLDKFTEEHKKIESLKKMDPLDVMRTIRENRML